MYYIKLTYNWKHKENNCFYITVESTYIDILNIDISLYCHIFKFPNFSSLSSLMNFSYTYIDIKICPFLYIDMHMWGSLKTQQNLRLKSLKYTHVRSKSNVEWVTKLSVQANLPAQYWDVLFIAPKLSWFIYQGKQLM